MREKGQQREKLEITIVALREEDTSEEDEDEDFENRKSTMFNQVQEVDTSVNSLEEKNFLQDDMLYLTEYEKLVFNSEPECTEGSSSSSTRQRKVQFNEKPSLNHLQPRLQLRLCEKLASMTDKNSITMSYVLNRHHSLDSIASSSNERSQVRMSSINMYSNVIPKDSLMQLLNAQSPKKL